MRIKRSIIISLLIIGIFSSAATAFAQGTYVIDTERVGKGVFTVDYTTEKNDKVKLMVEKGGTTIYYNLSKKNALEAFPLQMGKGSYTIAIFENTVGNQYKKVSEEIIDAANMQPQDVYLQSIQIIDWDYENDAVKKAVELTKNLSRDADKVEAIYDFIIRNINYDLKKSDLPVDYLPNIGTTIKTKKGMCYDFSALFAAMLRSIGVPTKLVKGQGDKIKGYHAWNEVYLDGKWLTIDTSFDAQMAKNKQVFSMYKDPSKYSKTGEF